MAKMTLLQIRTAARTELLETTAARWSDEQLNRYINDGQEDLAAASQRRVRKTVAVSAGSSTASVSSDVLQITDLWWESGGTRSKVAWADKPFEPDTAGQGIPVLAWLEGDTIRLWPAAQADGTLLVKGIPKPAAMGADSDTHDLPDYQCTNEALIAYCVWKAYETDYDPQREVWGGKYAMLKGRFAQLEMQRQPQTQTVDDVYDDPEPFPLTPWDYLR